MPLLLANFIYSRDCKLNLRKNVDTTETTPTLVSVSCSFSAYQSSFPPENKKTTGKILTALFLSFFGAKIGQNCLSKVSA